MNENYTITRQQNYKDYERIMFCLKALGNDSGYHCNIDVAARNNAYYLHVENGRTGSRLIATDGKRLHFANLSIKIPAGNYQPVIKDYSIYFGTSKDIAFPAWKNVVPKDADYKGLL